MFHDRRTYASSRYRCSRPKRGRPKVPFSWCICHILLVDYRWGSMGSNETAITIPGGLEKFTFFTATGRHRAQILYFLWIQIGSRPPSGIGLRSGGPLRRMRQCLGLSRELWIENFGGSWSRAMERKGPCSYVCTDGSGRACGVGDCPRLVPTLGDRRETSGPRIDRIPPARPALVASSISRIKKINFFGPQEVSH